LALKFSWQKNIGAKAAPKMLMKLTTGVNFINVLRAAFAHADPKSAKRLKIFALSGSACAKAAHEMLMKQVFLNLA
jgi:hypothetical protein